MDAIRAELLVKKFGDVRALNEVSISIAEGELFFLLGASGCGKTTLLRCLAGLETPTTGRVLYGDRDVTRMATHKREAAMVFQSYALWPHMSVAENVAFGLVERKVPQKEIDSRVDQALATVHLEGFRERRIDQMSGGQQQRVGLARALVVRPRCLLLDEPLSNLDAKLRLEMRREIRSIVKENNLTAVYVTHDQEEALSMADRMAVMDAGRVIQMGRPDEIYRYPVNAHVAGFIGETNLLGGKVIEVIDVGHESTVRVASNVGQFKGRVNRRNWRPSLGSKVQVSMRPEIFTEGDTGEKVNAIRGEVLDRMYLGSHIQYRIKAESGRVWSVSEMNPHVIRENGSEVVFTADSKDVTILRI